MIGERVPLLLLSDVDGTLISESGALPVEPVVLRARVQDIRRAWRGPVHVGLASSRTLRELTVLQRALELPGPCIAEDGARHAVDVEAPARILSPHDMERHGSRVLRTYAHATSAEALRSLMHDEPAFVRADTQRLPVQALRALGFPTYGAIRRALASRTHSVLLDPQAWSNDDHNRLRERSAAHGLQLRRGGRWFTMTTAGGKGPALRALRHQFTMHGVPPVIAAIGNEENDVSLLAEADLGFVIRNPHRGPHPMLSALPGVVLLDAEGPGGWMEMLDRLVPGATQLVEARP